MKRQYHKEYLTREELTAFLKAKLSSERLEKVRDVLYSLASPGWFMKI